MTAPPRLSRLWWFTGPVLALLVGAVVIVSVMRVPYVVLTPGSARSVVPLVTVSQKPGGPEVTEDAATDDLLYVTVNSKVQPSGIIALLGWLDDQAQVEPSKPFLGEQTSEENRALNLALMTDSQEKAKVVALERLGYEAATRDVIEVRMEIAGLPVTFLDTAGLRDTEDRLEQAGIDHQIRAEALSPEQFAKLSAMIDLDADA